MFFQNTLSNFGHLERDLVNGSKNTHIKTLVDRKSRYIIILKLKGKDASLVNQVLIQKFKTLLTQLKKSMVLDPCLE
jgi:IS30 family transposase